MACTQCNYFDGTRCWKSRFSVCCPDKFECPDFVVKDKEKVITELIKPCPFCGGEAILEKYRESDDGRMDKVARVKCKCGVEVYLTFPEFNQAKDDFGYKGGYYSQNKKFWNGMHQRLVDKWNNRATESEIRAKAIDEFAEKLGRLCENSAMALDRYNGRPLYNKYGKWHDLITEVAEQLKGE